MADGTVLRADVHRPETRDPLPVLLQRTPCDKGDIGTLGYGLDGLRAVRAGYALVAQDVRGRYASPGRFAPFVDRGLRRRRHRCLGGTLDNYRGMRATGASARARSLQRLVIGPWSHSVHGGAFVGRDHGASAGTDGLDLTALQLRWFDHVLRDVDNGVDREPPVGCS